MPRNGSGAYSLPAAYLATTGNTIQATQHNIPLTDIAADLNAARPVTSGGTGATTAAAARTNLGLGSLATQNGPSGAIVGTTDTQTLSNKTFADSTDATKKLALNLSGFSTGTTRTLTLPDQNVTISPYGASLIDDASASAARTTLGLAAVASSGSYADLTGKPVLATVATTGSYTDLANKPTSTNVVGSLIIGHFRGGGTATYGNVYGGSSISIADVDGTVTSTYPVNGVWRLISNSSNATKVGLFVKVS